jgi:membrane fusion protein, copper/silver efflux system
MTPRTRIKLRAAAVLAAAALIALLLVGKRAGLHLPSSTHLSASASAAAEPGSAEAQKRILYWYDPMHPAYHSEKPGIAPDCGMALVPMYESKTPSEQASTDAGLIHLPKEQQRALGLRLTSVEEQDLSRTLRTSGVVTADERNIGHVHVRTSGWVEEVYANFVGQLVHTGQPLFTFYSPDLVAAQEEYLIARRGVQKLGNSPYEDVARSSQSLLDSARERLKLLDLTDQQIEALDRTGQVNRIITVYSHVTGFVTDRKVFHHTAVAPDADLYMISDLSRVWVTADVFEADLPYIKVGGQAIIHFPYAPGKSIVGRIGYSYPELDPQTHTAKIRIDVPNPGLVLKPNMLADVELRIAYGRHLSVPAEAVLDSGTMQTVFVQRDDNTFEPRQVTIGATVDGKTILMAGVKRGQTVVESGNFLLDSETRLNAPLSMSGAGSSGSSMPGMDMSGPGKSSSKGSSASSGDAKTSSMPGMNMGGAK